MALMRPVIVPSTQLVEKKAMFLVSSGFSLEKSGVRVWGSDSPVREELSTWETEHPTVIDGRKNKKSNMPRSVFGKKRWMAATNLMWCGYSGEDGRFGTRVSLWVHKRGTAKLCRGRWQHTTMNDAEVDGKAQNTIWVKCCLWVPSLG